MRNVADSHDSRGTQGERYTPDEIALFEQLAQGTVKAAELAVLFPNRTVGAVKKQIVEARHRLKLIEPAASEAHAREPAMLDPDDPGLSDPWERLHRRDMTRGSIRFLEALTAA